MKRLEDALRVLTSWWQDRNPAVLARAVSHRCLWHTPSATIAGREAILARATELLVAFPEALTVEAAGTSRDPARGAVDVALSYRIGERQQLAWWRLMEGHIVEIWATGDGARAAPAVLAGDVTAVPRQTLPTPASARSTPMVALVHDLLVCRDTTAARRWLAPDCRLRLPDGRVIEGVDPILEATLTALAPVSSLEPILRPAIGTAEARLVRWHLGLIAPAGARLVATQHWGLALGVEQDRRLVSLSIGA